MLNISKPLVVFDLETTGTDPKNDRITQIAGIKIVPHPVNRVHWPFDFYCNPGVRIPVEVEELTGITNKFVEDKQPFHAIAAEIVEIFRGSDIGGYAVEKFDLPLLLAELARCGRGLNLADAKIVDAQKIYHNREQRRLEDALSFYCGKTFKPDEAHRANNDAEATLKVLEAMPGKYLRKAMGAPEGTIDELIALSVDTSGRFCDQGRKFMWRDGEPAFSFGKHKGRPLREVVQTDKSYLSWLCNKADDFDNEATRIVMDAMSGVIRKRPAKAQVPA